MSKKCLATLSRRWQTGANGAWRDKRRHFLCCFCSRPLQTKTPPEKIDATEEGWQQKRNKSRNSNPQTPDGGPGRWASPKKRCSKTIRKRSQTRSASSSSYVAGGDHSKHTSPCPPVYAGDAIEKKGLSLRSGVRAFEGSVSGILYVRSTGIREGDAAFVLFVFCLSFFLLLVAASIFCIAGGGASLCGDWCLENLVGFSSSYSFLQVLQMVQDLLA